MVDVNLKLYLILQDIGYVMRISASNIQYQVFIHRQSYIDFTSNAVIELFLKSKAEHEKKDCTAFSNPTAMLVTRCNSRSLIFFGKV